MPSKARAIAAGHIRPGVAEVPLLYPVTTEIPAARARLLQRDRRLLRRLRRRTCRPSRRAPLGRGDLRGRSAVLRLLHAPACTARLPLSDRGDCRRHRHVGLLVGGGRADRPGRRRLHRAARHPAGGRAGAPPGRCRRRRDHEARPQPAQGAPRAGAQRSPRPCHLCRARHHEGCGGDAARRQGRRLRALFRRSCWCRAGRGGRERASRRDRPRRRRCALAHAGGRRVRSPPPMPSTATAPISTAFPCGTARRATPPTTARKAPAPPPRCAMRRKAPRSRSSPAAIPACSPWRRRCAPRSRTGPTAWRALDLAIVPGITAMLAVAARVGAPLGHDFCALSLSDNLKPWELIERRLDAAAARASSSRSTIRSRGRGRGSSAPRSSACARHLPAATPVVFGRAVGRGRRAHRGDDAGRRRSGARRHGDADHRGLARDADRRRDPARTPLVYTPRTAMEASA